ncbi:MAG: hypothetical protein CME59_02335 [Halioglobus sp.]|nr:hypothetical protein [Halioglobus sp.]|tara:strand:- start:905 stop:1351 length:447 start_codon:yes stop_codon:yes gene_type:complete
MDQLDVANHSTLHAHPDLSAEEIAARIGVGYAVLNNKVNWAADQNKLSQREAISLQLVTNTRDIISAECQILGGRYVRDSDQEGGARNIAEAVLIAAAENGDVARVIQDALSDGRLTAREHARIRGEVDDAVDALNQLLRALPRIESV